MRAYHQFYINGQWVEPARAGLLEVINPATEAVAGTIALGTATDVDQAVAAARAAFPAFAATTREERLALIDRICVEYKKRYDDIAQAITEGMGAPLAYLSSKAQAGSGLGHFKAVRAALAAFEFEKSQGGTRIVREPAGVCALITPWNWPINQVACKVAPALAAGCTMVLKPSELAPFSAILFAEVLHAAGVPAGVFNLVNGDGAGVGAPLAAHPDVDMVSFTGSTRAGKQVMKSAADTVKKVALELGGKSANILLEDADFPRMVKQGLLSLLINSGQNCNAPSRMLVPESRLEEVEAIAAATLTRAVVGDPLDEATTMGPSANKAQYERVQAYIATSIEEGAKLVGGGLGRPEGLSRGYFSRPTVFSRVTPEMTIAREEVFGPVLSILTYKDEEDAIRIANDTPYGLSGYVSSASQARARSVARRLRTGNVHLNGAPNDQTAPFGGYKQSGLGREWGAWGLEEFLETKAILGYGED
ncbi:aldehyde dehydrogenase family protein [Zoogloea sp.]|uniref:aldehyde dehydrogenase family protein n=1 Tax=Zoogloea sp. TaxID=49181 RepID=UPI0026396F78|nr:aldehyde dehydrogenase family protein [Zoogloea sp.]MDD3353449.1 aldehyde dehydrogenase family protein [Zoogloea sp.]